MSAAPSPRAPLFAIWFCRVRQNGPYIVATGLLVVMAGLFFLVPPDLLGGAVRAFAEAALVGGLADWFAVTALFRRPLGLPIPHSAIVPRNKDRLGQALADFVRRHFMTSTVVARRLAPFDLATLACDLLSRTPEKAALGADLTGWVRSLARELEQAGRGQIFEDVIATWLRRADLAGLCGQTLGSALAHPMADETIDRVLFWGRDLLDEHADLARDIVRVKANWLLRVTRLDAKISTHVVGELRVLLQDMAHDHSHPLRRRFMESLSGLAHNLCTDPALRARMAKGQDSIVDWLRQARIFGHLAAALTAPASVEQGGDMTRAFTLRLGEALRRDPRLTARFNRGLRRAVVYLAVRHGARVTNLIAVTVQRWDARAMADRIEGAVGRDLQYIRINGALIGGLVGLILHALQP